MNDSRAVRHIESIRNLPAYLQDLIDWERAFLKPLRQRLSFHAFHYQVVDAILMADVVQRADVRMVQLRHGLRFARKSLRELGLRNLERDRAIEPRIEGFVNLPHAPFTQWPHNLVRAKAI
jgi:hypothetical protein